VIIAAGNGIQRGARIEGARLIDVTPTALYALGVPVDDDMDGRPLLDVFTDEFRGGRPVETRARDSATAGDRVDPYSVEEEDEIMDRLKGLGYIN
jgi:arylsulfatase A-like enzyme